MLVYPTDATITVVVVELVLDSNKSRTRRSGRCRNCNNHEHVEQILTIFRASISCSALWAGSGWNKAQY